MSAPMIYTGTIYGYPARFVREPPELRQRRRALADDDRAGGEAESAFAVSGAAKQNRRH